MKYSKDSNGFFLFTSCSRTLWWYSNKSRIDELHVYSLQLDGAHLPQMTFVGFSVYSGEWKNSGRKREWPGPTISLLCSFESLRKGPGRRTSKFWSRCSSKTKQWDTVETQSTCTFISDFQEHRIKKCVWQTKSFAIITYTTVQGDCMARMISQNRDRVLLQSSPTQQCKGIAWLEWFLWTEIEYFSNDSQHQGHHPRSPWRVIGKYSSSSNSSSRSSLNSRMTLRASGNSVLPGKAEQECEPKRNKPQKGEQPGNWCYPLLQRQMILQQRIPPSHFQHG